MSNLRIAQRYASALLSLTKEQKKSDGAAKDLLNVKEALEGSRDLQRMLASPIVAKEKKKTVLTEIFHKRISAPIMGYLLEIVNKGRVDLLQDILSQYFILRDKELGIVRVSVRTSVDFSSKQEKDLQKHLEAFTKQNIEITFNLDSTMKGGFIARLGDTVLDGSVHHQIELMRARLKEGTIQN